MFVEKTRIRGTKVSALDPGSAEALCIRGVFRGFLKGDWTAALADLSTAQSMDPNGVETLRRYAVALPHIVAQPLRLERFNRQVQLRAVHQVKRQQLFHVSAGVLAHQLRVARQLQQAA